MDCCPICLDFIDEKDTRDEIMYDILVSKGHENCHRQCFVSFVDNQIHSQYAGVCKPIYCPCAHENNIKRIVPFTDWKLVVEVPLVIKYFDVSQSLLQLMCSKCHKLTNLTIPFNEQGNAIFDLLYENDLFEVFLNDFESYRDGSYSPMEFYDILNSVYFDLKGKSSNEIDVIICSVLQLIEDPERAVNLYLRHLNRFPKILTPCCNELHCFKCHTRGFHENQTCEMNLATLDIDVVSCISCNITLTKGDGCDTITCVCGMKFSWTEEKRIFTETSQFQELYSNDQHSSCAKILCRLITGPEHLALSWKRKYSYNVETEMLAIWRHTYDFAASAYIAYLETRRPLYSQGLEMMITLWRKTHSDEVDKYLRDIERSKKQLLETFYPVQKDIFERVRQNVSLGNDKYINETVAHRSEQWVQNHQEEFQIHLQSTIITSAFQFLKLYGHISISKLPPSSVQSITSWNTRLSNSFLQISNGNKTVYRSGNVSIFPAAIANLRSTKCNLSIKIDEAPYTGNWFTFGLVCDGFSNNDTYGVGISKNSWGISDVREEDHSAAASFYSNRIFVKKYSRKLEVGDVITGLVDTIMGTFEILINNQIGTTYSIPRTSNYDAYKFACTLASDFKVSVHHSVEGHELFLTKYHNEMFENLNHVCNYLTLGESDIIEDFQLFDRVLKHVDLSKRDSESTEIDNNLNKDQGIGSSSEAAVFVNLSWNEYFKALCKQRLSLGKS